MYIKLLDQYLVHSKRQMLVCCIVATSILALIYGTRALGQACAKSLWAISHRISIRPCDSNSVIIWRNTDLREAEQSSQRNLLGNKGRARMQTPVWRTTGVYAHLDIWNHESGWNYPTGECVKGKEPGSSDVPPWWDEGRAKQLKMRSAEGWEEAVQQVQWGKAFLIFSLLLLLFLYV